MSRILSQDEIDALLNSAAETQKDRREPATPSGSVIRYNFRRPDRVSKEQIHSLKEISKHTPEALAQAFQAADIPPA